MENKGRLTWIDRARSLSVLMVVALHMSGGMVKLEEVDVANRAFWYGLSVLFRVAVPWFLMISGYLVIGKELSGKEWVQRRLLRLIQPWILWGGVKALVVYLMSGAEWNSVWGLSWWMFIHAFWFMPVLLFWYLMLPLTWKKVDLWGLGRRGYAGVLVGAVVLLTILAKDKFWGYVQESEVLLYGGYWLIGAMLRKVKSFWRLERLALLVFLAAYGWIMWHSLELYFMRGKFDANWYVYNTGPMYVLAVSSLVWFKGRIEKLKLVEGVNVIVERISKMSLGFYLMQVPVLMVLGWLSQQGLFSGWWEIWPIKYVLVMGLMYGVLRILARKEWLRGWVY